MTLIDLFREFSLVSTRENYSPSSRILYYTMLWCWNEQRRPEVTAMSTKQLYTLTGLPETTFREAFTYLADRGWVKRVKSRKRGLIAWLMRDRCGTSAPPAGFPLAPAQSSAVEEGKIADRGDFSFNSSKEYRDATTGNRPVRLPSGAKLDEGRQGSNRTTEDAERLGAGNVPVDF